MPLQLIALPIGNPDDISLRALKCLQEADIVVGEEAKVARRWLIGYNLREKIETLYLVNEHTNEADIKELVEFCRTKNVALFSDCGTPSFCDPGYKLVAACRKENISISSLPGPSSLMQLLSLCSERIDSFEFIGFLDRDKLKRKSQWQEIAKSKQHFVVMDTPYRFQQTMQELKDYIPNKKVLVGGNFTTSDEFIYEGKPTSLGVNQFPEKAEFLILIY